MTEASAGVPEGSAEPGEAEVIVVGAGPAGSSAAFHLARAGVDVLLLEKAEFPREKVCGDGLTPRAVHQLIRMGVDIGAPGWMRSRGMRWIAGEPRRSSTGPASAAIPTSGCPAAATTSTTSWPGTPPPPGRGCSPGSRSPGR